MNNGTNSSQALDRQIFFNDSLIMNPLEFDRDLSLSTDDLFNPHRQNDPEQLPGSVVPPSITPASEKLPNEKASRQDYSCLIFETGIERRNKKI